MPVECGLLGPTGKDILQILSVIGTWLAGLGAFSAALIALWLSKQTPRPLAKLSVTIAYAFQEEGQWITISHPKIDGGLPIVRFNIINKNTPPIQCDALAIGMPHSLDAFLIKGNYTTPNYYNKKIEFGGSFSFWIPVRDITTNAYLLDAYKTTPTPNKCEFLLDLSCGIQLKQPFPLELHTLFKKAIEEHQ